MATPSLWSQRLSGEIRRRLELAEAAAREARTETHAQQALDLVTVLAPRMAFDEAVETYLEIMDLPGDEAEMVHTRALALLSEREVDEDLARDRHRGWGFNWRYATPLGAIRYIQRQRKRSAEEELWMELAAARALEAVVRTHMEHALVYVEILEDEGDPARAVGLYLDAMEEPETLSWTIRQRVLAGLAETLLPRLFEDDARPAEEGGEGAAER